jgi:hypothetical protein
MNIADKQRRRKPNHLTLPAMAEVSVLVPKGEVEEGPAFWLLLLLSESQSQSCVLWFLRKDSRMRSRDFTLLDLLNSEQFQTVILLALGLNTCEIADLLDTSERTVCRVVCDSLDRTGCRSPEGLAARLIYECVNRQYDDRLIKELAELQSAAKKMLERIASTDTS